MAVASPHQPQTVQQLTPPSSSHGGQGTWDFAVPVQDQTSYADQQPLMSQDEFPTHPNTSRQPLAAQPNGFSKPHRANTFESQRQYYDEDQGHLAPNRVNELQRKESDISSDPDSVLEYYNRTEGKKASKNAPAAAMKGAKKKERRGTGKDEPVKDESYWIHRDKLAQIEIREMEEAGFRVGRASRSNSRSQSTTSAQKDRKNSVSSDPTHGEDERPDHRRVISPIPAEDEEVDDDPAQWDLRTPEEIAADNERAEMENWALPRQNHILRPSTSRIPIAKTSPLPVGHTHAEPRSRKGSNNWSGDTIAVNGARMRSGSNASAVFLDEPEIHREPSRTPQRTEFGKAVTGSPPKTKVAGKPTPGSGNRKNGTQRSSSQAKPRVTSGSSPLKRPGTSGGSISRPGTSHRPEGEAPWIATMYKPDPRLPPDQQIIPTHAKRMQQEQWESEGKAGNIYDRDFKLLNPIEFENRSSNRNSRVESMEFERPSEDREWPIPSPTKNPTPNNLDAKSPTSEQGAWKLTPTIPQSPRIPSPNPMQRQAPVITPAKPKTTTRLPEPPVQEKEEEKKGCCCIVM
ncbi:hypothetical protein P154DRAFT_158039 [Amniculicola lignicola CBS 123094]|uniref:Uncharacterized protein n=1 Tax=Amniculicola lignicola CBS 123094 TaxID=1392246 RepID=A0A6A5WVP9_9PLEO|nr:hypothetical protein P154DRAFT_158039 [Amniculicola lignicola CBS 123094]